MNAKTIEARIKRAGLETQFKRLYQGYVESGVNPEEALKLAGDQILPAIMDWETNNREIVHAKRTISLRKRKLLEQNKEELRKRIEAKERRKESILAEAKELYELDHPSLHPSKHSDDPWGDLALAVPANKETNYADDVRWVYNNAKTPVEAISPAEVPSRGALTLLQSVQNSPTMYSAFMKDHWSRLIPSKSAIEAESRFRSGNRKLLDMFRVFEDDLKRRRGDVTRLLKQVDEHGELLSEEEADALGSEDS